MPKIRSEEEKLAGKLISQIQKIWADQVGDPLSDITEVKIGLGHTLLQARCASKMKDLLGGKSVMEFLGEEWLRENPSIQPIANTLNRSIYKDQKLI